MFVLEYTLFLSELFVQYPVILLGPERKIMIFISNSSLIIHLVYLIFISYNRIKFDCMKQYNN